MCYGAIRCLLLEEFGDIDSTVLIESPFIETTRNGQSLRYVYLALTPSTFITAKSLRKRTRLEGKDLELTSLLPLVLTKLSVFKTSTRQSLKACVVDKAPRYFQLNMTTKKEIFWNLWCSHVSELSNPKKLWPFSYSFRKKKSDNMHDYTAEQELRCKWSDKYLYLGSKREQEDKDRPIPVPGLGPTEAIKLLYLKREYFGCWDQSEHWVQCDDDD